MSTIQKFVISPDMEDQEFYNEYIKQKRIRRKYICYKGQEYLLELDPRVLEILKERRKKTMSEGFKRYLSKNREHYNELSKNYMRQKKLKRLAQGLSTEAIV